MTMSAPKPVLLKYGLCPGKGYDPQRTVAWKHDASLFDRRDILRRLVANATYDVETRLTGLSHTYMTRREFDYEAGVWNLTGNLIEEMPERIEQFGVANFRIGHVLLPLELFRVFEGGICHDSRASLDLAEQASEQILAVINAHEYGKGGLRDKLRKDEKP